MKYLLFILILFNLTLYGQVTLINEQFSSTPPAGWLVTASPSTWVLYDGTATGNYRSSYYSLRLPSASNSNTKVLYVPIKLKDGYTYTISFWTKRVCSLTISINDTTDQVSLYSTITLNRTTGDCNSNFNLWYKWSYDYMCYNNGNAYIQIQIKSVYGGPTSVYLDDFNLLETPPIDLPIELLLFDGKVLNNENELYWITVSEVNNDYFSLEKSDNDIDFTTIGLISGNGTSTSYNTYYFYDTQDIEGVKYYRLKQTDFDGKTTDIKTIALSRGQNNKKTLIRVTDILGQELNINRKNGGVLLLFYNDGSVEKHYLLNK